MSNLVVCDLATEDVWSECSHDKSKCYYAWGVDPDHEIMKENCGAGKWVKNQGAYKGVCPYNTVVNVIPLRSDYVFPNE